MSIVKCLTFFASLAIIRAQNTCPTDPGWFQAGLKCYYVSQHSMNWYEAKEVNILSKSVQKIFQNISQFCWSKGAYLAEIKSAEEDKLVYPYLLYDIHYWIGLNDLATDGKINNWFWL